MIRFLKTPVATSVQDAGRVGNRAKGHARSGAMDLLSLECANRAAGAVPGAAGIEMGPGPCAIEITRAGTIAFAGASRNGAPWAETLDVVPGQKLELSPPHDGMWSYLAAGGGIDVPIILESRSTCVREGIGAWIMNGDEIRAGNAHADPVAVEAPPLGGPIRLFGELAGRWRVGTRADRMGYLLEGEPLRGGTADEWSEPLLPGFIQVPPGGIPIALMTEGPTVGGYRVTAIIHSQDVRLLAQTRPGQPLHFIPA